MPAPTYTPAMHVRPASPDDAATLAALQRWVHDPHVAAEPAVYVPADPARAVESLRARLVAEGVHGFVAEVDGAPVGYALAAVARRPATVQTAARAFLLVDELAVAPTARRRGAGRALMDAVGRFAASRGLGRVELEVRAWNDGARRFYADLGYAPFSLRLGRDVTG